MDEVAAAVSACAMVHCASECRHRTFLAVVVEFEGVLRRLPQHRHERLEADGAGGVPGSVAELFIQGLHFFFWEFELHDKDFQHHDAQYCQSPFMPS